MTRILKNFCLLGIAAIALCSFVSFGNGLLLAANEDPCSVNPTSEYCQNRNNAPTATKDPVTETVQKISNIVAWAGGVAAVFWIIIQGIKMQTSYGNAEKVTAARKGIIYAAVGLAIIIVARLVILFVMKLIN